MDTTREQHQLRLPIGVTFKLLRRRLPPLLAGEGWGGVKHASERANPLPTSPCKQGEE